MKNFFFLLRISKNAFQTTKIISFNYLQHRCVGEKIFSIFFSRFFYNQRSLNTNDYISHTNSIFLIKKDSFSSSWSFSSVERRNFLTFLFFSRFTYFCLFLLKENFFLVTKPAKNLRAIFMLMYLERTWCRVQEVRGKGELVKSIFFWALFATLL